MEKEIKKRLEKMSMFHLKKVCQHMNMKCGHNKMETIRILLRPLNKYRMHRTRGRVGAKKIKDVSDEDIHHEQELDFLERLKMLEIPNNSSPNDSNDSNDQLTEEQEKHFKERLRKLKETKETK